MSESIEESRLLEMTAQIVAAHVAHNRVPPESLPDLIRTVHSSLAGMGKPVESAEKQHPAVPVKKSVFPDFVICLEDGKKLKMLKRHLARHYNLTPEQYREKWGLPREYPMVAPNYAERRSALAKQIGLGRKLRTAKPATAKAAPKRRLAPALPEVVPA
jgi:predicted transcriptional regulator